MMVWCSRNSENNTSKYPDLAADVPKLLKQGCSSVVLDCEAVAYDRVTKKILPFQVIPFAGPLLRLLPFRPVPVLAFRFPSWSNAVIRCSMCLSALSFALRPCLFGAFALHGDDFDICLLWSAPFTVVPGFV